MPTISAMQGATTFREEPQPSIEQIENELEKDLIRYSSNRRQFYQLTESLLSQKHSDLIKQNANIHRRLSPVLYTLAESVIKASDVAATIAPQAIPVLPKAFKQATGITVFSFKRFKNDTGVRDDNRLADAFGRAIGGISAITQSAKHVHDNITTGEKTELKGQEDQCRSENEFKKQDVLRLVNEEQQAMSKLEQAGERRHRAKENVIRS